MKNGVKGFLVVLILFLTACKAGKEAAVVALPAMTATERVEQVVAAGVAYDDLSSHVRLSLRKGEAKEGMTVDAALRVVRGEAIQLSVRLPIIGSEAARVVITPERVLVVDRLNRQYVSETVATALGGWGLGFDFYALEALITNRLFGTGGGEIRREDYALFQVNDGPYSSQITRSGGRLEVDFESDYTHRIRSAKLTRTGEKGDLRWEYGDWAPVAGGDQAFPMSLRVELRTVDGAVGLDCSHKSVEMDKGGAVDYTIPAKYRQVSWAEVVKGLGGVR
jgi:hypothetical protein